MASTRMSILSVWIGMQIRWQVLVCLQAGWRSTQHKTEEGWWLKCSSNSVRCTTIVLRISGHRTAWILICSCNRERCTKVGLRISSHRAAGIFIDFTEEPTSLGTNSTSTIHKSNATSSKHLRKQRSVAWKNQVKVPHQRSPCSMKFQDNLQTESQERCARGDAWRLAKNILMLWEKDKATIFSATNEWCLPAPSVLKPEEREFKEG